MLADDEYFKCALGWFRGNGVISREIMQFLQQVHAPKVRHSGGTFLEHLVGTHNLLHYWGNSRDLCLAGLFHSVYGTDRFTYSLVKSDEQSRHQLRQLIGANAEHLAFLFCSFGREDLFGLSVDQVLRTEAAILIGGSREHTDLLEIEAANFLEQRVWLIRNGQHPRAHQRLRKNLTRWAGYLMPPPESLSKGAAQDLKRFFHEAGTILSKPPQGDRDAPLRRHRIKVELAESGY